jgi:xanthine dehydrogenase molybdopterin-binding subunit B
MRIDKGLCICALAVALQGCAAAGVTLATAGAGVGMGAGVEHTLNGIVYKTFGVSINELRFAALKTLDHMDMPVTADEKTETGWKLTATASERTIDIEFERLTERTTRMRVVANEGMIFFKDASTATEIITQTAQTLQDDRAARTTNEAPRKRSAS